MSPIIISIEGNIGAGKSTILSHLRTRFTDTNYNVVFMNEPVDIWETITDENGQTILSKFYEDPKKYAFMFQVTAYTTRMALLRKTIKNNPDCDIIICERCLSADRNIFAKMLYDDGLMDHLSYQVYLQLYHDTFEDFPVDGIVYMNASPERCIERINTRRREGESGITLEYLTRCQQYYFDWFESGELSMFDRLMIDADHTAKYDMPGDIGWKWLSEILTFVEMFYFRKKHGKFLYIN